MSLAPIDDCQLYYELSGDGDPLVFIHGNAGDRRHWDHQFAPLANNHLVLRYDVRGYGKSSSPRLGQPYSDFDDLLQLLDYLEIDRAHIAGWSMGSGIAIDFILAYPDRAMSLISVGPWVNGYSSQNVDSMFTDMEVVAAALTTNGRQAATEAWMMAPFFASTVRDPSVEHEFRKIAEGFSWWAFMNESPQQQLDPMASERLSSIELPTLIITADHDIPACLEIAEAIVNHVPHAQKVVLADTGHLMHVEKPNEFNALLIEFLKSTKG